MAIYPHRCKYTISCGGGFWPSAMHGFYYNLYTSIYLYTPQYTSIHLNIPIYLIQGASHALPARQQRDNLFMLTPRKMLSSISYAYLALISCRSKQSITSIHLYSIAILHDIILKFISSFMFEMFFPKQIISRKRTPEQKHAC